MNLKKPIELYFKVPLNFKLKMILKLNNVTVKCNIVTVLQL